MKNNVLFFLLGNLLLLGIGACVDLIETDFSDETVVLLAPADYLTVEAGTIKFWWEPMDGATDYQFTLVSPRFDSSTLLIEEVELVDNEYSVTLEAGQYQWKVVALNSAYTSLPSIHSLTVLPDSTTALSTTNLLSPLSNTCTNAASIALLWKVIPDATAYRIQIASPDFSNSTFFIKDTLVTSDHLSLILGEGSYQWRVRGENALSLGSYVSSAFAVDRTPPSTSLILSPLNGDTILNTSCTFSWNPIGDSVADSIEVYSDINLTNLVYAKGSTATSLTWTPSIVDTLYYWRLISKDKAHNYSPFSATYKFRIQ